MLGINLPIKFIVLIRYFKPHRKKAIVGGIFMLLNVALLLPTPLLTMFLIDKVLPQKNILFLGLICLLSIFITILSAIFGSLQDIFFQRFNECVIFKIQLDLFQKVQSIPYAERKKMQTGYLLARVTEDPERLHSLLVETLFSIIKDVLTIIFGCVLIFYIHWKLALIAVAVLPVYSLILRYYNKKIHFAASEYYESRAHVSKKIQESFQLFELIRLFSLYKYDTIKLFKYLKLSVLNSLKRVNIVAISSAFIGIISGLGPIFVIWYGIYEIMNGRLSLGELIAFNAYLGYLFGPTSRLMKANVGIQQSVAAWDRIFKYLKTSDNGHINTKNIIGRNMINGDIFFENVSFSYDNKQIIKNVTFRIPANKTIALIGESGSGKTSLTSLITLLNTDYSGEIYIDNINIRKYNILSLKRQIAVVTQEPSLFYDTIYNNIKIGDSQIMTSDVIEACKIVNIHDFIEDLPEKYDTILDERGVNLSIGQKQRIAIARAIVRNPRILILDEPTSNLDSETEKLIYNSLKEFSKARTTIVITHKLSINLKFDYIFTVKHCAIQISKPID